MPLPPHVAHAFTIKNHTLFLTLDHVLIVALLSGLSRSSVGFGLPHRLAHVCCIVLRVAQILTEV